MRLIVRFVALWIVAPLAAGIGGMLPPQQIAQAQTPCGVVDAVDFPLDTNTFRLIFDYNVPSSRYDGRLHAGEDWVNSNRAQSYGQPVRAIARGRVTYSAPLGWGRDKGVVIVEHVMRDGRVWYSFYGHMEEFVSDDGDNSNDLRFPPVFTCVERGQALGGIGHPRPAPHLHFEIRNFMPDSPGPGYWGTDPTLSGWRRPSKFILNWQTWFNPAYRWYADISDEAGPAWPAIIRPDNAMLLFDDDRLLALTPNGEVLWRYIMDEDWEIIGTLPYGENILVAGRDGELQLWSQTGGWVENWPLPHALDSPPYLWNDLLITHTPDGQIIAYGPDRAERWRVPDVPLPVDVQGSAALLAVASTQNTLTFLAPDGRVVNRAQLRRQGSLAPAPDGGFYILSRFGLWQVSTEGVWQLLADAPAAQIGSLAFYSLPDGRIFVYTGSTARTLYAYTGQGAALWTAELAALEGAPFFFSAGGALLLADGYGHALAVRPDDGAVCNTIHAWGWRAANAWAGLGADGVLRLHIADQVLGLDWATFTAGC